MKYLFYLAILVILYIAGMMIYNNYNSPKEEAVSETQKVELDLQNAEIAAQNAINDSIIETEENVKSSVNSAGESLAAAIK